jgi:hypothetical protein
MSFSLESPKEPKLQPKKSENAIVSSIPFTRLYRRDTKLPSMTSVFLNYLLKFQHFRLILQHL